MQNKKMIRELIKNKKGHEIFEEQSSSDLHAFTRILEANDRVVVQFNKDEWEQVEPTIEKEHDCFKVRVTRQYIASKILSKLGEKYPQLEEYRGKDSLEVLKKPDVFKKREDLIYNLYDVRDILDVEGISVDRIHFMINGIDSSLLCDSLSLLLRDDTPYDSSIYLTSSFTTQEIPDMYDGTKLWEGYNYTIFHQTEEGKKTNPIKNTKLK